MQSLIVGKGVNKEDNLKFIEITPCNRKMVQGFITHN